MFTNISGKRWSCQFVVALSTVLVAIGQTRANEPTNPVLQIRQLLPESIQVDSTFTVEVQMENTCPNSLNDLEVQGVWTDGFRLISAKPVPNMRTNGGTGWKFDKLEAGQTHRIQLIMEPTEELRESFFRTEFRASYREVQTDVKSVEVKVAKLDFKVEGPSLVVVGQPAKMQISLNNPEDLEVRGVKLSSHLVEGLSHPGGSKLEADVGVIAGKYQESIPLILTPTKAGRAKAVFKLAGTGLPPIEREVILNAIEAKLNLTMHGPKRIPQDWPGMFEIVVTNEADDALNGAELVVSVPEGFEELRATGGAKFDGSARLLIWKLPELQPKQSLSYFWLALPSKLGDYPLSTTVKLGEIPIETVQLQSTVVEKE